MRVAAFVAFLLIGLLPTAQAADLGGPLVLVAKPELQDPVFRGTVLLVIPLGADQHAGFIVNRPTILTLGKVFPEHGPSQKVVDPVYLGGPVESELIFALVRRNTTPGGKSFQMGPGLFAEPDQEPNVVNRDQSQPQDVFDHEEVAQIAPGVRGTGFTVAPGIERLHRPFERGAFHVDSP